MTRTYPKRQPRQIRWIGLSCNKPLPCVGDITAPSSGPFYSPNHVLSWWPDDQKHRAWLTQSIAYYAARGFTMTLHETVTVQ